MPASSKAVFRFRPEVQDQPRLVLKRISGNSELPLFFGALVILDTIGVACGFGTWFAWKGWQEGNQGFWVVPVALAGVLVPLGVTLFSKESLLRAAISRVEFFPDEQATVFTYLGLFRRRIRDLPSWIEISSVWQGNSLNLYSGVAALRFGRHRRIKIPLLFTTGRSRDAATADRNAAEVVAGIREALHPLRLAMDLPDEDAFTTKKRWQLFFCGLILAGFSAVFLWATFHLGFSRGHHPRPIVPDPHSLDQLFSRLAFSGAGVGFAALAVGCFWFMLGPDRLPKTPDKAKFYRWAAGVALLWGALAVPDCVASAQARDGEAFWLRLIVRIGVPLGAAATALVKAARFNRGKSPGGGA